MGSSLRLSGMWLHTFIEELQPIFFLPDAPWGPLRHLPRPTAPAGLCVQHDGDRFFVQPSHHVGVTVVEAVTRRLHLDAASVTTCVFMTPDFSMAGSGLFWHPSY